MKGTLRNCRNPKGDNGVRGCPVKPPNPKYQLVSNKHARQPPIGGDWSKTRKLGKRGEDESTTTGHRSPSTNKNRPINSAQHHDAVVRLAIRAAFMCRSVSTQISQADRL
ncbi:hypothetical protein U1Q18_041568 [Sarracenia purpurea var. burkii]